jgi:hypothetical protein
MPTNGIHAAPKPKRDATKSRAITAKAKPPPKPLSCIEGRAAAGKPETPSTNPLRTKQDRVLALLTRPNGATIADLMQATEWQQHSVRGFLAGTIKKKLGRPLTSSKVAGEDRRYRIETGRSR